MTMKSKKSHFLNKGFLKVGVLLTAILGLFFMFSSATVENAEANEVSDYSMYHRASEIATAFGTEMAPSIDEDSASGSPWVSNSLTAGNAGGILGYSRELQEDEEGAMGWITSRFSANSMSYSFDQLTTLGGSSDMGSNSLYAYAAYGAQLEHIGLATTEDLGLLGKAEGFLFNAVYTIAQIVPAIFKIILNLMTILNPFQLFFGAVEGVANVDIPIIGDLAAYVSGIYTTIQDLAIVVTVPILIGLTAVSIFMFRGNAGKKLLRVVVRVFMIFAGLPLIGATYTSVVDGLADDMEMGTPFSDYVIATQFVDTEGWMMSSRLAPPTENPLKINTLNDAKGVTYTDAATREMVLEINTKRVAGGFDSSIAGADISASDSVFEEQTGKFVGDPARDLLNRYRNDERVSASDYEGFAKAQLDKEVSDSNIANMFAPNAGELADEEYGGIFSHNASEATANFGDDANLSIYNMGGLTVSDGIESEFGLIADGSSEVRNPILPASSNTDLSSTVVGLSPMAMYNFLNTDFESSSMTVYSPETSSSSWASNDYASVSRANNGVYGFIYSMESLVLLVSSAVIGLFYAFSLVKILIASIPRIMTSVFGTAVGSMAMITKLLVSTIVLLMELIGTMLLYSVFDQLFIAIIKGVDSIISGVSLTSISGVALVSLKSLVVIVLGFAVVYVAISNRTAFGKMVEEVTTDIITKLMGGLDNSMNQGNMFHDGQGVQKAGQAASVLGADGNIGTEGSGIYDSKLANGENPNEESFGMKDALQEEIGQEALKKQADDNYEGRSAGEMRDAIADRYKGYKKAGAKDKLAGALGGAATLATLANSDMDLSGNARERLSEAERAERRAISDKHRGIGDGASVASESTGFVDSSVDDPMGSPEGAESVSASVNDIDNQSMDEILNEADDMDDEMVEMDASGGAIAGDQMEYGSVKDAVGATETDAYDDVDEDADQTMMDAMGDDVDSISLDDPDSHPDHDVLGDDNAEYIDNLGVASDAQMEASEHHASEAERLDDLADEKEAEANAIDGKNEILSEEDAAKVKNLRAEADSARERAESHKEQGRHAKRKADKLNAKRTSAQAIREQAKEDYGNPQSASVQNAERKVEGMKDQKASLDSDIRRMENAKKNGKNIDGQPVTQQDIDAKKQQSAALGSKISKAERNVDTMKQNNAETLKLGNDAQDQFGVAQEEAVSARKANDQADQLERKAESLEQNGGSQEDIAKHREQAQQARTKAETHQENSQKAQQKGEQLQKSYEKSLRKNPGVMGATGSNQSAPVQAAQQFVQSEQNVQRMEQQRNQLDKDIDGMTEAVENNRPYKGQSVNPSDIVDRTEKRDKIDAQLGQARTKSAQLQQQAVDSLPDDGYVDLASMNDKELATYAQENGIPPNKIEQRVAENPTPEEHQRGRLRAARSLAQMGTQLGDSPGSTGKRQKRFMDREMRNATKGLTKQRKSVDRQIAQKEASLDSAGGRIAEAKSIHDDLVQSGASASEIQSATENIDAANKEYKSIDNEIKQLNQQKSELDSQGRENKTFMRSLNSGYKGNKKTLGTHAKNMNKLDQSNRKIGRSLQNQKRRSKKIQSKLQPRASHVLSNDRSGSSQLARKRRVLASEGIQTQKDYNNRLREINKGIPEKMKELEQVSKRLEVAQEKGDQRQIPNLRDRKEALRNKVNNMSRKADAQRDTLMNNAAGLYHKNGYRPQNKNIGSNITADLSHVTKTAEDLAKTQARWDKLHKELKRKPSISSADKKRQSKLRKQLNGMRSELRSAGVRESAIDDQASLLDTVKALNAEWDNVRTGRA